MFLSKHSELYLDLSSDLRESEDWNVGTLRPLEYLLDVVSFAIEPLSGLLAVGTASGVIHIFGRPGVLSRLTLPEPVRIKFLQFAVSVFKLICVDSNDSFHVWDLASPGRPKLQKSTRFNGINALTLSASHTHAFLALQSGEIKTYDLICLRKSPYVIPNMWALYEEQMVATSIPEASSPGSQIPVEVVVHPRDLNLVFVAYGGGIILSDLSERSTLRAYELVIPAGAPGGRGYGSPDLLTHRRPSVTCLAIHPAGHFFVVGHADGTMAFWAVEDEDHPLFVRTIDDLEEVNIVDGDKIEQYLPSGNVAEKEPIPSTDREPVFKLSWSGFPNSSDPRGGETALTVLGGLMEGDRPGVTVLWLPPFNPPEPPASAGALVQKSLHPFLRNAMRESILPSKSYFYATVGPTQDFLLLPRNSPHFAAAFDPVAIILLSDTVGDTRTAEAFQFPPPELVSPVSAVSDNVPKEPSTSEDRTEPSDPSDVLSEDLASTLRDMSVNDDPKRLNLAPSLWNGNTGVVHAEMLKLEPDAYETFTSKSDIGDDELPLKGGIAWMNDAKATEAKLSKYQPHRLLITHHRNHTVQFQDISAQLLLEHGSPSIQNHFPKPLHAFTIELNSLLTDAAVTMHTSPSFISKTEISSVHLAGESLECAVVFKTGELALYRLGSVAPADMIYREAEDKELIIVEHIPVPNNQRYHPYFILAPGLGQVITCALSDIGFLAVSYADGSLLIVDMRGPTIIFRSGQEAKSKHKHMSRLIGKHSDESDVVMCLNWTVCGLGTDPRLKIRLIASRASGYTQIFSLRHPSRSSPWELDGDPVETETLAHPIPRGSFIVDANTGAPIKADRSRLAASLQDSNRNNVPYLWITASAKGVRCIADITGERVAKADWSNKVGGVESIQLVEKSGSHALVAFTDKNEAVVYSLPHLEQLQTLRLPESDLALSVDTSGDFLAFKRDFKSNLIKEIILSSLFDIRRAYSLPDVDFASTRGEVPSQPQPVSAGPVSLLSGTWSWFAGGGGMTGDQVDELLAGPDRPMPEPPKVKPAAAAGGPSTAARLAAEAQSAQSNLYARLSSALNDRGQALGDLEDRFNSLESGSKSMVSQAKRLAAEQGTKAWFKFK